MTYEQAFEIAKKYAKSIKHDVVNFCVENADFHYFYIDYSVRPRYLGLPIIIKIDNTGKVILVSETNEQMWAFREYLKTIK